MLKVGIVIIVLLAVATLIWWLRKLRSNASTAAANAAKEILLMLRQSRRPMGFAEMRARQESGLVTFTGTVKILVKRGLIASRPPVTQFAVDDEKARYYITRQGIRALAEGINLP